MAQQKEGKGSAGRWHESDKSVLGWHMTANAQTEECIRLVKGEGAQKLRAQKEYG